MVGHIHADSAAPPGRGGLLTQRVVHTFDSERIPVFVAFGSAQYRQGADRWGAFLERFPDPVRTAEATPADVVRAWTGLGYNRRGLNLRAARSRYARTPSGQASSIPGRAMRPGETALTRIPDGPSSRAEDRV